MGFLNTNSMPRLVEKLADGDNIKITGNSKGNRVGTVVKKIVEKADEVTKAIEQEVVNDSYSFKVGTGDVDVSTDVEDGFGEVGIKGVTYQNLAPKGVALCDDASKFTHNYFHVTVTQQNGFVQCVTNQEGYCVLGYDNSHYNNLIQPNKCYITLAEVEIIKDTSNEGIYVAIPSHISYKEKKLQGEITKGVIAKAFKTNSDVTTNNNGWLAIRLTNNSTSVGDGFKCYYVSLFEISEAEFNNLSIDELIERYNYKCEGIVGVGDKSKNLFNIKDFVEFAKDTTESPFYYPITLEANTQYTFSDSTGMWNGCGFFLELLTDEKEKLFNLIDSNLANRNKFTFTTNAKTQYLLKLYKHNVDKMLSLSTNFQLEKGSTATTYEPYYDGHKIEILSNGKNLFKPDIVTDTKSYTLHTSNGYWGTVFKVKPNTDYRITSKSDGFNLTTIAISYVYFIGNGGGECWIVHQTSKPSGDSEGIVNSGSKGEIYIRMPDYTFPIIPYMLIHRKIQIEEGTTGTTYTPYIEDKTQILLDEPLMRLPNGVCDEISRDRKLIRRVGKVVLNGSEDWKTTINLDGLTYRYSLDFKFKTSDNYNNVDNIICNDLATKNFPNIYNNGEKGITTWWSNDYIKKTIAICLSNNYSLEQFKEWLSQNPTTVYYELETPITTELPAPYLRIFKDGHLTFNTLVAPESNHVVQLNKSAQIERNIREVQSLDSRVGKLESFYDDMMLETSHKLSLLNYDFEYTRERNCE